MHKIIIAMVIGFNVMAQDTIYVSDYLDTVVQYNLERNTGFEEELVEYDLFDFLKQKDNYLLLADYAYNVGEIENSIQLNFNFWYSMFFYLNDVFDNKVMLNVFYKEIKLRSLIKQCLDCHYNLYANSHKSSYKVFRRVMKSYPKVNFKLFVRDLKAMSLDAEFRKNDNEIWYLFEKEIGLKSLNDDSLKLNMEKQLQYEVKRNVNYKDLVNQKLQEYRRLNGLD